MILEMSIAFLHENNVLVGLMSNVQQCSNTIHSFERDCPHTYNGDFFNSSDKGISVFSVFPFFLTSFFYPVYETPLSCECMLQVYRSKYRLTVFYWWSVKMHIHTHT